MEEGRSDGVSIQIGMGKKREGLREEPHHHRAFFVCCGFQLAAFFPHTTQPATQKDFCVRA